MLDRRRGLARIGQRHAELRTPHAAHRQRCADLHAAQRLGAGGHGRFHAALVHLQHRLHAACAAPPAQLAQLQLGLRLYPHHGAVRQLHGHERLGADVQLGAFFQLAAGCNGGGCAAAPRLRRGLALHKLHRRGLAGLQPHGDEDQRARLQAPRVSHLVAGLQQRPLARVGQVAAGQPFQGVAFFHGVGNFIVLLGGCRAGAWLGREGRGGCQAPQGCNAGVHAKWQGGDQVMSPSGGSARRTPSRHCVSPCAGLRRLQNGSPRHTPPSR